MNKIPERIRSELLKKLKKPHGAAAWLSEQTGLTPGAISNYLNKGRIPEREPLMKIAIALGVSPEWILTGNGHSATPNEADYWKARALAAEQRIDQITASIRGILDQSAVAVTTELPTTPKMRPESKIATGNESAREETE